MTDYKPILCLDFDGVLHSYTSGWEGAHVVSDPPVDGALEFLVEAVKHFEVHIYSSRSHQSMGIHGMQTWLGRHLNESGLVDKGEHLKFFGRVQDDPGGLWVAWNITFPSEKPPAHVTLDDRGILFEGEWPSVESLLDFKPWNKR